MQSKDPRHEVALIVDGVFDSPEQRLAYANDLAAWLNYQIAHAPAPEPQVPAAETVQSLSESTASRLDEAPEPELAPEVGPLSATPAAHEPIEPALDLDPEPVHDMAPEPSLDAAGPASITQRVTKLIHSTSFPLGRKPAKVEPAPPRAEKPSQELADVVCEPLEEVPAPERKTEGPCACHFDLQPGQQPDACVIDLGHPECCTIALSGVAKELCPHWLPIRFVPRAQRAQA